MTKQTKRTIGFHVMMTPLYLIILGMWAYTYMTGGWQGLLTTVGIFAFTMGLMNLGGWMIDKSYE